MLSPITLAAMGVLALAAPAAAPVPATPAVHATPAVESRTRSWSWNEDGAQEIPASLDWEVKPTDNKDAAPGSVDFEIGFHAEHHSQSWGRTLPLADLAGLTSAQLQAEGQPVSFTLRRDAGDFRCKGVAGQGKGLGNCVYVPNPAFPAGLAKRGVGGDVTPFQQFELSMSDTGFAFLDELKRQAYATPSADDLVRAGTHGASLKYLTAMSEAGYRFGDVAALVHARDHGVSARFVGELKAAGYTRLSAPDLIRLRDHGVSATFVTDLKAAGYAGLAPEDLVRLRDHGVSATFVAELHAMGYDRLTPDELTRLRDHGISAGFVRVSNQGGAKLTPEELIRLRDRGGRRD